MNLRQMGFAALAVVAAASCGGAPRATGLAIVTIDLTSQGWRLKKPAVSQPELGHMLLGGTLDVNACFKGIPANAPASSWTSFTAVYADVANASLKADFGTLVKVPATVNASAGTNRGAKVTLGSLQVESLDALYVDPAGACATDDGQRARFNSATGQFLQVLSRAMKAGSLQLDESADIKGQLSVDVSTFGGTVSGDSSATRSWTGTNIYFSDLPACVNVKHQTASCQNLAIGPGNTCDLTPCTFQASALQTGNGAWQGSLSCPGSAPVSLQGTLGQWWGQNTAPGVTYNVRLKNGAGINSINVEIDRWDVISTEPSRCIH